MGWGSGGSLFNELVHSMKTNRVEYHTRIVVYKDMIKAFENMDCDTLYESLGSDHAFNEAYKSLYPEEFSEWESYQLDSNK